MPGDKQGLSTGSLVGYGHAAACNEQHDKRFPGRSHRVKELPLWFWKIQGSKARSLSAALVRQSQGHQHDICTARQRYCLGHTARNPLQCLAALAAGYPCLRETLPQPGQERHRAVALAEAGPCPEHLSTIVGKWSDKSHALRPGKRENSPVILQQHHGLAGHVTCHFLIFRKIHLCFPASVAVSVRILEQSEPVFLQQYLAAHAVHKFFAHQALPDKLGPVLTIAAQDHRHIEVGVHRHGGRLLVIRRHAMVDHLIYRTVIRHHEAAEPEFTTKQVIQKPAITGSRNPVKIVE